MKTSAALVVAYATVAESYPGELIYSCAIKEKEWDGEYTPWAGNTKHAHAHLTFDDGPFVGDTDVVLDVLKEYNTKATFFFRTDHMNDDTRYLVDRVLDEGHLIGSHTSNHKNLQYGNETILEEEIEHAHHFFKDYLGFQPKIFRPPYGGIDHRSHQLLEELGYTIIMWSAGCVDWWFTDNDKDLETSIAAMRYSLAEAGGVVCMHDTAQSPNNGERLRKFLDDTWNFWQYTDFLTCIDRKDVDEGHVFKTYSEYRRAVEDEAKKMSATSAELPDGPAAANAATGGGVTDMPYLFNGKSGKSTKSCKDGKSGKSRRGLRPTNGI